MTGRRWRHLTWRVAGLGVLALMTLGLSGCLVIQSEVTTQLNFVGNVQVDTTFCSSDSSIASTCPDLGAGGVAASGTGQAMVAYRIPVGATAPTTITSVSTLVTVTQNASYSSELTRRFPPPATQKWVGYVSNPQTFNTAGVLAFELLPEFTLPGAADGGPFVTPFLYRTVSGIRRAEPPALTTRPVVCGATTTDIFSDSWDFGGGPVPTTTCFDSPSVATIPTNVTRSTRDLGVIAGGSSATTAPGATAQLPFTLKYSGTATAGANFSITASTTLPGAVPQPSLGNLTPPTDSSTQAFVNILVPAGATPGTYDVTLTASLANGQTRIGVGKLTVPSPPPPPPPPPPVVVGLSFSLPKGLLSKTAVSKGIRLSIKSNTRIAATAALFQGKGKKPLVSKKITLKSPGPTTIILKSAKFKAGAFKVVISGKGFKFVKLGKLK